MAQPTPAPQKSEPAKIKCRVMAPMWEGHGKGEIVEASEHEIRRTTSRDRSGKVIDRVLLPLDEEEKQKQAQDRPDMLARSQKAQKARTEAWAALTREAEDIHRREESAAIERLMRSRGAGAPAA